MGGYAPLKCCSLGASTAAPTTHAQPGTEANTKFGFIIMSNTPKAPNHLSPEARCLWDKLLGQWSLDAGGLVILESALEAFDRLRQAQKILKRDGLTTKDRFGQLKAHPLLLVERDSRNSMARLFRQLGIDLPALD